MRALENNEPQIGLSPLERAIQPSALSLSELYMGLSTSKQITVIQAFKSTGDDHADILKALQTVAPHI